MVFQDGYKTVFPAGSIFLEISELIQPWSKDLISSSRPTKCDDLGFKHLRKDGRTLCQWKLLLIYTKQD